VKNWKNRICSVLIVDDDVAVLTSLTHFLTDEGFDVLTAENPFDAYNIASELLPDLIISDIHMPGMDGFELRNKLKGNPNTAAIPVIFLTADNTASENTNALSNHSNLFITKPFMFEEILKAINDNMIGHDK